jgi:signal transduction histidine kinase
VINNARQAIEEQAPAEPLIRISLTCDEAEIKIIIYNSGQAVPESDLERIFEPYFSSKGNSGTGLGLHICRQIIENKYNGSIRAVNKKGGVEFELKLPRQKTTFKKDMV